MTVEFSDGKLNVVLLASAVEVVATALEGTIASEPTDSTVKTQILASLRMVLPPFV
jgi:hypothetical protein